VSEKRFAPSAKKIRKARESGDVAKSRDLTTIGRIGGAFAGALVTLRLIDVSAFGDCFQIGFPGADSVEGGAFDPAIALAMGGAAFLFGALGAGALSGAAAELAQVGFCFCFELVLPNFERLSAAENLKQIFGLPPSDGEESRFLLPFGRAVKPLLLLGLLAVICCFVPPRVTAAAVEARSISEVGSAMLGCIALVGGFIFGVSVLCAVASLVYVRRLRSRRLRMDIEELKEELKHNEGNPELRAMRKQLHEQILEMSAVAAVRRAKAVVIGRVKGEPTAIRRE
jgi:flagellar biosynthesis protein FlhB